jgi:septal ring factor EnvC (AmiA/AmiB activator)
MTRAKEVKPGSGEMPNYKSPDNRLVHCLRNAYDNGRVKIENAMERIKYYQVKTRDLEKSRARYKDSKIELEKKLKQLEKENEDLKKQNKSLEIKKKKEKNS